MSTFYCLILFTLFATFSLPILTPSNFYVRKLKKQKGISAINERLYKNIMFVQKMITLLFLFGLIALSFRLGFSPLESMMYFFTVPFFQLLLLLFLLPVKEFLPAKIKKMNSFYFIGISVVSIIIAICGIKITSNISDTIPKTIPNSIASYANDNNYIIFSEEITKLTSESGDTSLIVNNSETHYLFVDGRDKNNTIVVYDRLNPSNSFEAEYDELLELNEKTLVKRYPDILDNFYKGENYAPVCYLVNEKDILVVYGLAEKNEYTNDFFISKYVIFDMTTGELFDLEK